MRLPILAALGLAALALATPATAFEIEEHRS